MLKENEFYEVKPQYNLASVFLQKQNIFMLMFGIVWTFLVFFGMLRETECKFNGKIVPCDSLSYLLPSYLFAIIGVCLILLPELISLYLFFEYRQQKYELYRDRISYIDGFFNQKKRILKKNKIDSISLTKRIFQRFYNLGTIYIYTVSGDTIEMKDIPYPNRIYDILNELYLENSKCK